MVKDVAMVEIRTRDLRGPMLARELGAGPALVTAQEGPGGCWSTSAGSPTSAARAWTCTRPGTAPIGGHFGKILPGGSGLNGALKGDGISHELYQSITCNQQMM
jgi:hypothetical protein